MSISDSMEIPGLSVPTEHGQHLIVPPIEQLSNLVHQSHQARFDVPESIHFCGLDLAGLRQSARQSAIQLALKHTAEYRSLAGRTTSDSSLDALSKSLAASPGDAKRISQLPIVMGGHQPDLFHCGVWFKNFLLSHLAQATGGVAIHFLVDNDLCRSTSIEVPQFIPPSDDRTADAALTMENESAQDRVPLEQTGWRFKTVFYDRPRDAIPWEYCRLQDPNCWRSFPERVRRVLPRLEGTPLLERLWKMSEKDCEPGMPLGLLLSRYRHQLEAELGLSTLEVPLSQLVATHEFARFSLRLLADLPQLFEVYNDELKSYRNAHRIRNHAQPIPSLIQDGQWIEAPWWHYHQDSPIRQPLWISKSGQDLLLSNRSGWQSRIAAPLDGASAVDQWADLLHSGNCLRPRALLTTMYARLVLSDLFVHGMGGARYDQLTDRIIERMFGMPPPPVALATATVHLPIADLSDALSKPVDQRLADWQQKLRGAQSNPEIALRLWNEELSVETAEEVDRLVTHKQSLLANIPPKGEKWKWHHEMKGIHQRLAQLAQPNVSRIQSTISHLQELESQQAIVHSREFSFCLFPRETIRKSLRVANGNGETGIGTSDDNPST